MQKNEKKAFRNMLYNIFFVPLQRKDAVKVTDRLLLMSN